jgi:hypothetical protein
LWVGVPGSSQKLIKAISSAPSLVGVAAERVRVVLERLAEVVVDLVGLDGDVGVELGAEQPRDDRRTTSSTPMYSAAT